MCGLVGIAGKLEYRDEATIKRLLVFDVFRGMDSTGLAVVDKDGGTKIAKIASHPLDLFDSGAFTKALSGYNHRAFIGHNRYATTGGKNTVNAHPYEFGHIIGAHNGTLSRPSWKELEELADLETDVDSQAVFAAIAVAGIEEVMKRMQGAWALTWYDKKENTLNFLRNKERPLWYAYSKNFDKIFWASEYPMIQAATEMSTSSYDLYCSDEGYSFFPMEENWWYRFDLDDLSEGLEKPKPRVKLLKGKEPAPVVQRQDPFQFRRPAAQDTTVRTTALTTTTSHHGTTGGQSTKTAKEKKVVNFMGTNETPFGPYLDEDEFEAIAMNGCSWCHGAIDYTDKGVIVYPEEGIIICNKCTRDSDSSRLYVPESVLDSF